jgi:hypothetical protein
VANVAVIIPIHSSATVGMENFLIGCQV